DVPVVELVEHAVEVILVEGRGSEQSALGVDLPEHQRRQRETALRDGATAHQDEALAPGRDRYEVESVEADVGYRPRMVHDTLAAERRRARRSVSAVEIPRLGSHKRGHGVEIALAERAGEPCCIPPRHVSETGCATPVGVLLARELRETCSRGALVVD